MSNEVRNPVIAAIVSAGLAGVIAWNWQRHSFEQSTDSREFLQTQLIETLQASAAASERVATHIDESNEVLQDFAVQIDDLGDEQRQLNRWIETMMGREDP